MSKSREELVHCAHAAAAGALVRCHKLTDAALTRARRAAFNAILTANRGAGTATHPHAAYSHGVGDLAAEGVDLAADGWRKLKEQGGTDRILRRLGVR